LIEHSVQDEQRRREVGERRQTIADALMARGEERGRRQGLQQGRIEQARAGLLLVLRQRFPSLPKAAEQAINRTTDLDLLQTWMARTVTAATLDEVGIVPPA
jgi:hypothetical protein